jgi:hypothetical protein
LAKRRSPNIGRRLPNDRATVTEQRVVRPNAHMRGRAVKPVRHFHALVLVATYIVSCNRFASTRQDYVVGHSF